VNADANLKIQLGPTVQSVYMTHSILLARLNDQICDVCRRLLSVSWSYLGN